MPKKSWFKYLIIQLILILLVFYTYTLLKQKDDDKVLSYMTNIEEKLNVLSESIVNDQQYSAKIIYKLLVDAQVVAYVEEANKLYAIDHHITDEEKLIEIREALYQYLKDNYSLVRESGFFIMQFHLSQGYNLLRFNHLAQFGDEVALRRKTVSTVIKTEKPVHGFDVGQYISGYRYTFPIFNEKNEFIGVFEVGHNFDELTAEVNLSMGSKSFLYQRDESQHEQQCVLEQEAFNAIANQLFINVEEVCNWVYDRFYIETNDTQIMHYQQFENQAIWFYQVPLLSTDKEVIAYSLFFSDDPYLYQLYLDNAKHQKVYLLIALLFYVSGILLFLIFVATIHCAYQDNLTKLLNRRAFHTFKVKKMKNKSLLMLDLDDFKKINDDFGHPQGDLYLSEIGSALKKSIRNKDSVIRWGGEEFIILLHLISVEDSLKRAEYIRKTIEDLVVSEHIQTTVSIGVAQFHHSVAETIKRADIAVYQAKMKGKNQVVLYRDEV